MLFNGIKKGDVPEFPWPHAHLVYLIGPSALEKKAFNKIAGVDEVTRVAISPLP